MKFCVQVSLYLENGETSQEVIEITSEDIASLAKEKAKENNRRALSATAKRIELLPYCEEL